jgi:MFS family permease
VLHAGTTEVSALAATGLAVGAAVAVPLGPWVEFRRKRPVMVAMDLTRFAALMSIPAAYALGWLSFAQLLVVAVVVGAADIAFKAASGACLKALVPAESLLVANGRLESTTWTATMLGPPLGGAAIGLLGPVTTVVANAVSFVLSAAGIRAIGGGEPRPARTAATRLRAGDLLDGWRYILGHPALRPLFFNTVLVNGLILATAPLLAVLMLGDLGFAPWQYGLAFAVPCAGGLLGSRLAGRLVARFGRDRVMRTAGTLRACWSVGLAFIGPGTAGLVLVMVVELGLITCMGVFNPVFATHRLEQTATDRVVRTLSAWSVTSNATIAVLTALWGLLAAATSARTAIAVAGVLMLATPLLLPRGARPRTVSPTV